MVPEGTGKEGSEAGQGAPPGLLCPCLSRVQLLRDKQYRPLAPYTSPYSSMCMSHGSDTCPCPLQEPTVAMQVPCLPSMSAPQLCHGQFTGQPLARSGSRSGISESPAQVLQPQRHPPGPGTRIMGKYLESREGLLRASHDASLSTLSHQRKPSPGHRSM